MSEEFGWTPDEIRRLTLQEFDHYIVLSHCHRQSIRPTDCSLEAIRSMLAAWFGFKEPDRPQQAEEKIQKLAAATVTKAEKDAWFSAGMPSPFGSWLAAYRKGR